MKKIDKKAFTLIELIVVVAVVGILVLLGMPRFIGYKDKAELARIQQDVKVMEQEVGTVLINNDDDFNKWGNNSKNFNQLIRENKLFEKEGPVAEDVEPMDEPYKVIPEKYKDKINTKLKGTFYANSDGKVYYEHEKPLLGIPIKPEKPAEPGESENQGYSDEEIADLKNKGFIPVATADELNSIRNNTRQTYGAGTKWEGKYTGGLDKRYVQVANVDLSEHGNWTPIGDNSEKFKGTYDGGNYVIRGLVINGEGKNYQGLFGRTYVATIRNVGLIDNKVTGRNFVGGLVGSAGADMFGRGTTIENSYATGSVEGNSLVGGLVGDTIKAGVTDGTKIINSYATGSVTGSGYEVGGLVGETSGGTRISNSYATVEVEGARDYVGGLVGLIHDRTNINNSYTTGSVTGTGDYVGGLVGGIKTTKGRSIISNSYSTGSTTGKDRVGGLVGDSHGTFITISNSYSTGSVTGSRYSGGLVGLASNSTIENSYWDTVTTGQISSAGGVGKSTNEMKEQTTYLGWDFEETWKIDDGNDYPKLR